MQKFLRSKGIKFLRGELNWQRFLQPFWCFRIFFPSLNSFSQPVVLSLKFATDQNSYSLNRVDQSHQSAVLPAVNVLQCLNKTITVYKLQICPARPRLGTCLGAFSIMALTLVCWGRQSWIIYPLCYVSDNFILFLKPAVLSRLHEYAQMNYTWGNKSGRGDNQCKYKPRDVTLRVWMACCCSFLKAYLGESGRNYSNSHLHTFSLPFPFDRPDTWI